MDLLAQKLRRDGNLTGLKMRPARALIGWMPEREAHAVLALPLTPTTPAPEHIERVQAARAAVWSRPAGLPQTHVLSHVGPELDPYLAELEADPRFQPYAQAGWQVRLANLNQICALQPLVHLDYPDLNDPAHSASLSPIAQHPPHPVETDLLTLAKITLPFTNPSEVPAQLDPQRHAWVFESPNPDTRIVGRFSTRVELTPGMFVMGYGFCVAMMPSFVQVVLYRGRYFLKDGYHRSLAFLNKGITQIPVLFRAIPDSETLLIEGALPEEITLGPRPPRLTDYLRDDVSASTLSPAFGKTITIQPLERLNWN